MLRWLFIAGWALAAPVAARAAQAMLIELEGPIGPASSSHVSGSLSRAVEQDTQIIVLRLDTPGGLDSSMHDIVKSILASPIPVLCWVGPGGARAASAGTFILQACHLAAMAPGTNLGAATPVPIGGSWPSIAPDQPRDGPDDSAAAPPPAGDTSMTKAVNDAAAYIRGLAEMHGRNAEWAERAVRAGVSLSASAALAQQVIELIAANPADLLRQADGRSVRMAGGVVSLSTSGVSLRRVEPGWRLELLAVLSNPTVAYLLLIVGIYGLLLEGFNPGAILPGVVGAISLLLAAYALQMLPVNYAGLALIALGVALLVVEGVAPSFGLLGLGGIVAFVLGSVLLMDTDVPGFGVSRGVIAGIAFVAALLLAALAWLVARARRARVVTGSEALLGATALALEPIREEGWAEVRGERWRVRTSGPLAAGQPGRVVARDGLLLRVEPSDP